MLLVCRKNRDPKFRVQAAPKHTPSIESHAHLKCGASIHTLRVQVPKYEVYIPQIILPTPNTEAMDTLLLGHSVGRAICLPIPLTRTFLGPPSLAGEAWPGPLPRRHAQRGKVLSKTKVATERKAKSTSVRHICIYTSHRCIYIYYTRKYI